MRFLLSPLLCFAALAQQPNTTYEELPAYKLFNSKIEVTVLSTGATLASIVLVDDPSKLNPLWNPIRFGQEAGQPVTNRGAGLGHFLCLDGFGPVSPEEIKAGIRFHGEAVLQKFKAERASDREVSLTTPLPLVQEMLTRTVHLENGENVVYVHTKLESKVAFDRPVAWAEHATVGSPFLDRASAVFDLPAIKSKTRPYDSTSGPTPRRFASDKEFTFPQVPLRDGTLVDIRSVPAKGGSGDHSTNLLDRSKKYGWVTVINPARKMIIGWIFKSADFPWLQVWENFPTSDKLARGLEFSTQPFDVSRRDAVALNGMFGAPTFRWLPAMSTIETDFAMFYAPAPEGFQKVKEVRVENGSIVIEEAGGKRISLPASKMF